MSDHVKAGHVRVMRKTELAPGKTRVVEINGDRIAIFNVDGKFYAIDDTCTHAGGPLSEGEVDGTTVTCPWHGASFDLCCGEALSPPAEEEVKSYEVTIEGDEVILKL